ncbi:MAG: hypothetical protein GC184_06145 [Rhizobiales bacterium]|nr:hypothetical protein [Hyphomicrobiales bacterium]
MARIIDTEFTGRSVRVIGDPHIARIFKANVPLHRRGEREKMVNEVFRDVVSNSPAEITIIIGDLFDRMVVPYATILETAEVLKTCPGKLIVLRGNHDASKDADIRSAFDVLIGLCMDTPTITFVTETYVHEGLGFYGWHPFKDAAEIAAQITSPIDAAFGHWDIESFGGVNPNLIPIDELKKVTSKVFTGHVHTPQGFTVDGVDVTVTGSLQPYAHGEDPELDFYLTLTLEQFNATPPATLVNKYVRVMLKENEVAPEPIDCLGFTTKREGTLESTLDVAIGEFDMMGMFRGVLEEAELPLDLREKILERYQTDIVGQIDA